VVAHFHYVLGGTAIFSMLAAVYYWWPKVTGRFLSQRLGRIQFWLLLIGFNMTFFVMHLLGLAGMPRRIADYSPFTNFELWNSIATAGYLLIAVSFIPFFAAVVSSLRGPRTSGADPWHANTLEWATTSPPPAHNFDWLPPIRSERPLFDLRWSAHGEVGRTVMVDSELAHTAREPIDTSIRPLGFAVAITGILLGVAVGLWVTAVSVGLLAVEVARLATEVRR
ncbi:MAG: cbb3-type cytochrome c oxidase subunit I, partial [Acidimicrobiales bacterium]|nr:cbb3-type cytochrome c oxidase subunit I [Acidimicrobiales bacterium]